MEDLLAQLELDNEKNGQKIVTLLVPSYFPSNVNDDVRVQRCVQQPRGKRRGWADYRLDLQRLIPAHVNSCLALMREHQSAGRSFYYLLCRSRGHVVDSDLARFAHVLGMYVASADQTQDEAGAVLEAGIERR